MSILTGEPTSPGKRSELKNIAFACLSVFMGKPVKLQIIGCQIRDVPSHSVIATIRDAITISQCFFNLNF